MRLEYRLKFSDYLLFSAVHQFLSLRVQAVYLIFPLMLYVTRYEKGQAGAIVGAAMFCLALWILQLAFNAFHYWPGIARVVRRPGFAAVYISAVAAHIIPRRAFASDQQVDQFVALV